MASQWNMRQIRWMLMFVMVFDFRSGFCDLTLKMKAKLTGVRRDSLVIPCRYTPQKQYEEIRTEWFFESDQTVIHRIESEDTVPLVRYRGRVELSKSPPGDVSLTIKKLEIGDQGHFKCKVTWKDGSGKLITKDDVTTVRVIRKIPVTPKPLFTTEEPKTTKIPVTPTPLFTTEEAKTTKHLVTNTPSMEIEVTAGRTVATRKSHEDISNVVTEKKNKDFHESTTTTHLSTAELPNNNPEVAASKGSGRFLYIIIVGLACIVCILILMVVLVARKKKKKAFSFNLPTSMNQLAMDLDGGSHIGGGCSSSADPASRVSNDYELCMPVSEYQTLPVCSFEYEQLITKKPEEENGSKC